MLFYNFLPSVTNIKEVGNLKGKKNSHIYLLLETMQYDNCTTLAWYTRYTIYFWYYFEAQSLYFSHDL